MHLTGRSAELPTEPLGVIHTSHFGDTSCWHDGQLLEGVDGHQDEQPADALMGVQVLSTECAGCIGIVLSATRSSSSSSSSSSSRGSHLLRW